MSLSKYPPSTPPGQAPQGLRERKKARTRAAIVSVALPLFVERGYAATTVADIAEAADVAQSTVFAHFPTKDDIVFHRFPEFYASFEAWFAAPSTGRSVVSRLHDWMQEFLVALISTHVAELHMVRRVVQSDERLVAQERARMRYFEDRMVALLAAELGEPADAFAPRLIAAAAAGAANTVLAQICHLAVSARGAHVEDVAPLVASMRAVVEGGAATLLGPATDSRAVATTTPKRQPRAASNKK